MSQAVIHNGTVYLAGQVADDTSKGTAGQTAQILAKIDSLLAAAGTEKSKILSATIWLTDMENFEEMNGIWDAWVPEGDAPARACVESKLARPEFLVEIGIIAAAD